MKRRLRARKPSRILPRRARRTATFATGYSAGMHLRIHDETTLDVPAITALIEAAFLHAPHSRQTAQHIVNAQRRAARLLTIPA